MAASFACKSSSAVAASPAALNRSRSLPARCVPSRSRLPVIRAQLQDDITSVQKDLVSGASKLAFTSFAALAPLALTSAAYADDASTAAVESVGGPFSGIGAGEAALLLAPLFIYALFNLYRERFNPKAQFLDYIYIIVFAAIVGNLFSILVFKTRFF